jgi:N-acetyl sugar amidotransferase
MDTSAGEIVFDNDGYCNFCSAAMSQLEVYSRLTSGEKKARLDRIFSEIRKKGKGKKYDSIIGLSGGIDSSYLAYLVKNAGLRPLAIHLDNGWNTELAVKNIHSIVTKLGIDLYTHVIDWNEFRELQRAFIKASVIDLELLSDHAILSLFYKIAGKYRIKYLLGGGNLSTESILPSSWIHSKYDGRNIMDIYKKHGRGLKLKTYPYIGISEYFKIITGIKKVKTFPILDLSEYRKEEAIKLLQEKMDYRPYPHKHSESKITHFYQAYLLTQKFGVDKRRAHLSSMICSRQLTREQALSEMQKPLYDPNALREDIDYFKKKLELTDSEFEDYITSPRMSHNDYKTYDSLIKKFRFWKNNKIKQKQ